MPESATPRLDGDTILANARALGPAIEAAADDIARERRLPTELVEAMRRAGIFRIAFPRAWGGPEMDILQQCALMEILAFHDASTAWVAMICSSDPSSAPRPHHHLSALGRPAPRLPDRGPVAVRRRRADVRVSDAR